MRNRCYIWIRLSVLKQSEVKLPCYFHFSGQNIIKCITFCSKTQKIVINQYFLKYLRQSDCYLFRFSTSQIWTYYSNIIQILSGVSKDGENPLLKLLIRDSYLSALVSLGTVQHCRLFLSLLGGYCLDLEPVFTIYGTGSKAQKYAKIWKQESLSV